MLKIWLPYVTAGSGSDVFTLRLAEAIRAAGHEAVPQAFPHKFQYAPTYLRRANPPQRTNVVLANSWNGFAFKRSGLPLIVVEHHCVLDPAYAPYRSFAQGAFHRTLIRHFERLSFRAADRLIVVSDHTARIVQSVFPWTKPLRIYNGIDTEFFTPAPEPSPAAGSFTLLFVGNNTRRKGTDLLARIMAKLPGDIRLRYTGGLRDDPVAVPDPRFQPIGRLSDKELLGEYRRAHALLFPTRYEGFGYTAAEAMACGTPVIASDCTSLPEVVRNGQTGILCSTDNAEEFANAVRLLVSDRDMLNRMSEAARQHVVSRFSVATMVEQYLQLLTELAESKRPGR